MKKFMIVVALLGATVAARAATVACADTTLATLTSTGFTCAVDDKIFSAFSYTAGTGAPTSAQVEAHLDFNAATLTYGWTFTSSTGSFVGNFSLGYTVAIDTSICSGCRITSVVEQMLAGTAPSGSQTQSISVAESAGTTPININNLTFGGNTNGDIFAGALSVTKLATASGLSAGDPLLSFESDVRQSVVPEPMTLSMMGIGLVGLGLFRRRQLRKK